MVDLASRSLHFKAMDKEGKDCLASDDRCFEARSYGQTSSTAWYNDLFDDAIKFAEKGATSVETYKMAKEELQKAFAEIVGLEETVVKPDYHNGKESDKKVNCHS